MRSAVASGRVQPGSITVICGSMFSGKTEELIRLIRRSMHARKSVQVFKSSLDTRCNTTVIRTHDDTQFNAIAVPDAVSLEAMLEPGVQVVGIEEVQFLDEPIVDLCVRLADGGVSVIVAGLDQDFRGRPFTFMPRLMALAETVMKLHAICKVCGEEASRTQRLVDGRPASWNEPTILIGADDTYEARCRRCHRVRNVPKQFRTKSWPPSADKVLESPMNTGSRKVTMVTAPRLGLDAFGNAKSELCVDLPTGSDHGGAQETLPERETVGTASWSFQLYMFGEEPES